MASESNEKKSNRLQVFLVVLIVVSMGLNVYLFRYYAEQDDGVEVMTSWADANTQIHEELAAVTTMLADLEARQSAQETTTKEIYETLVLVDTRQAAQDSASVMAPEGLDKESWEAANTEVQAALASVTTMLADLEARQSAQETTTKEIYETLVLVDARQAAQDVAAPIAPDVLDKESWEAANTEIQAALASVTTMLADLEARQSAQETTTKEIYETLVLVDARQAAQDVAAPIAHDVLEESWEAASAQIQQELVAIKALLDQVLQQNEEAQAVEPQLRSEIEPETSIQVMASAPELTYEQQTEHGCSIATVRLLPGDSVWSIVARFRPSPSPALVDKVVEFNEITDPRRLPVGFPVQVPLDLVNGEW